MTAASRHALRSLARNARAGRLWLLAAALVLAVAAVGSVNIFTARIGAALERQSGDTLGADALLSSRDAIPEAALAAARKAGAVSTAIRQFTSVAAAGDNTALVSVKAVSAGYPLRGKVRLAQEAFGLAVAAQGIPEPGSVWADLRVLTDLGLQPGQTLTLGTSSFTVTAIITDEPGRSGFTDLAPRLLMNDADVAATGLVTLGSRVSYSLQLAGPPAAIAALEKFNWPAGLRFQTPKQARPELASALQRAGRFLAIAALATALLAAAAVALAAQQHGASLRDEIALLKAMGARRRFLLASLALQLIALGVLAGAAGAALAYGGQALIASTLAGMLDVVLPAAPLTPLLTAFMLGLLLLAGFAIPPVLATVATPPTRVFAREVQEGKSRLVPLLAMVSVASLLLWQTGEVRLAAYTLAGAAATAGVLAALAYGLVRALSPLKDSVGASWRFGLGNVARRRAASVGQVVALGLALLALLLITVVRQDLLSAWKNKLPADAPNQFAINIQPSQLPAVQKFFEREKLLGADHAAAAFWPMTRARLSAINGKPVSEEKLKDEETRRWVNREFNLSWTDSFGPDNRLTTGTWWTAKDRGKPWLSVDEYAVERLGLKLGDTLTLDFAGTPITLTVHNTRKVAWESFKPNFFLATPPGVLEAQPAQYITSFHLLPGDKGKLRALIAAFPNVTVFDMDAVMSQVRGIVEKVVSAVEFVFTFALAAGLLVLLTAIHGTRELRSRETALLRALGARSATLRAGLLAEYATLGLLAGTVASAAAQVIAAVLAVKVFELPFAFSPLLWLVGCGAGMLLVTGLGWVSIRGVLRASPRSILG